MYASVIVEIGVKNVDHTFTYKIPDNLIDKVKIGIRVKVPFGNQLLEGFVINITNTYLEDFELREIIELVDEKPILNEEMIWLGKEISRKTLCSLISAYQVMLPKALKASYKTNIKRKYIKVISLNKSTREIYNYLNNCKYLKQKELIELLIEKKKIIITKMEGHINTLLNNGIIKLEEVEEYRYKYEISGKYKDVVLNNEQNKVVESIDLNKNNTYLLYGVTGSGKTEVYMKLIENVINMGKTAIMLVPEISLTPQIVDRFVTKFGDNVAILHSGLSDAERYDEYRKIKENKVKIVVGARSAIFAPFTNLGIIIIDEEHTSSYKQENHPRYHARDVAILRSNYHNCPLLLGSATPSLESYARATRGVYKLLTMLNRVGTSILPKVEIVNMKEEVKKNNYIFSNNLKELIKDRLTKHEQIILLLNRRGYSSIITCSNCGHVEKCPNCDITLTYHKTSNNLTCHYCGYNKKRINNCSNCKSTNINDYGLGTEKLEEEIIKEFGARVVRMDVDTTSKKGAHQKIIEDFGNYKYDILVGTQMIAKGLDFPLVTLVGVINADTSLNIPDFRSSENTFQLLSQVSGRAGRSTLPGKVVIQTYNPDNYAINYAKTHDYLSFYKEEMLIRKQMKYSPYYYLTLVLIKSKDYEEGYNTAKKIGKYLRQNLESTSIVLGPTTSNVFKINNVYNWECIIKYKKDIKLIDTLIKLDNIFKTNTKVNIEIDVEPLKL